ncbi:MAG: hypothetical protein WC979_01540 [Candidatus Pacearchaeota archaeon]|jgi:hypothetical protein|nr:hypothetical protein [Clostridia bacterium]
MKIAPFIKPIKTQGGTFYTCSSAAEDLQLTLSESKNKFRFSNFSLLKLPELKRLRYSNADFGNTAMPKPNHIQLDTPAAAYKFYADMMDSVENNNTFAESFQNYYYNLETLITAEDTYTIDNPRTVSERVFFKWLKEIGAIRFRQANSNELAVNSSNGTAFGARYVEEDETYDANGNFIYERVVKYIGNINVINSVKNPANSYSEVYVHIPTNHGSTRDVLFNAISDNNYKEDMIFKNLPVDPLNDGVIYGRSVDDVHPAGLRINAHYDSLDNFNVADAACWYFNPVSMVWVDSTAPDFKWWFPTADKDTYHLEPVTFNNAQNDIFAIGQNPNDTEEFQNIKFIRNRLDGISLEFQPSVYNKIATSSDIKNLGEYNASAYAESFSFNTVLVYYDVYNEDNPSDYVTNLFGVLFLDNIDTVPGVSSYMQPITKYKPDTILQQNGNAYAFKLNIRYDVTAQDPAVEISINDYNTYSLHLYLDALSEMRNSNDLLTAHISTYKDVLTELDQIKSLIYGQQTYDDLSAQIDSIQKQLDDAAAVMLNNENLVALLNKNYEEITNIYKNYTSVQMSYNLDSIKQGAGINIDRSTGSYVTIANTRQGFNIGAKPVIQIGTDFTMLAKLYKYIHPLVTFDNYIRISDGTYGTPLLIDRDIYMYADDTNNKWEVGQKLRISFENGLNMDNENGTFNLFIYTDALDKLNTGYKYNTQAAIITYDQFTIRNNKPVIELICIDADNLKFVTDIF